MNNALPAQTIKPGDKVRLTSPNWDGPGLVTYTVFSVMHGKVTLQPPKVPGLAADFIHRPASQVVAA